MYLEDSSTYICTCCRLWSVPKRAYIWLWKWDQKTLKSFKGLFYIIQNSKMRENKQKYMPWKPKMQASLPLLSWMVNRKKNLCYLVIGLVTPSITFIEIHSIVHSCWSFRERTRPAIILDAKKSEIPPWKSGQTVVMKTSSYWIRTLLDIG